VFVELRDRALLQGRRVVDAHAGVGLADRAGRGTVLADNDHRELAGAEAVDHSASETPCEFGDIAIGRLVAEGHAQGRVAVVGPFRGRGDQREGVAVVDRSDIDIGASRPGHRECLVGVGGCLEGDVFTASGDPHRAVATPTRDVGVGDQDTGSPVHPHHRLEHVDGVGDHRAGENVIPRDRGPVENCARVRTRWCVGRRALPRVEFEVHPGPPTPSSGRASVTPLRNSLGCFALTLGSAFSPGPRRLPIVLRRPSALG
jgi:hypothetical protein